MPAPPKESSSAHRIEMLTSVLDELACPACFAGLRIQASDLVCAGCGRIYPMVDGIPVLIPREQRD